MMQIKENGAILCLPEKTAFLRGGNDLIDIVFRSSYQYFSARG